MVESRAGGKRWKVGRRGVERGRRRLGEEVKTLAEYIDIYRFFSRRRERESGGERGGEEMEEVGYVYR